MSKMTYTVDTGNWLPTHILHLISYKNGNHNERVYTETLQAAATEAASLKEQGAQNVRVRPPKEQQQ